MSLAWDIVRLMWSPRRLAETAAATPTWLACLAGIAAGAIALTLPPLTFAVAINEPYPTFADYLAEHAKLSARAAVCAGVLSGLPLILVSLLGIRARTVRERAAIRAVLLSPMPFVAPMLAWGIFLTLASAPASIINQQRWAEWPPFLAVLGSCWWGLLFVMLYIWLLRDASDLLDRMFAPGRLCPGCGYDLSGAMAAWTLKTSARSGTPCAS